MHLSNFNHLCHQKTKYESRTDETILQSDSSQLWTRNFVLIALINLLVSATGKMLDGSFSFYVIELGGDNFVVGLTAGLCAICSLIMRPIAGWVLDNISRKLIFFIAVIGLIIIPFFYMVFPILGMTILLRCMSGICWSTASTSSNTNACDIIPRKRFGEGMGFFGLTNSLATAIAPALGLLIMEKCGFNILFISCAAVAIVVLLLLTRLKFSPLPTKKKIDSNRSIFSKILHLFNKDAIPAAIFIFLAAVPSGAIYSFIALYASIEGLGSGGLFFTLQAIFTGVSRIFAGKIADTKGEGPMVYMSVVCFAINIILLVFGKTQLLFCISACLMGLGLGLCIPAMQTMAVRIVPPERRGSASSTFLCSWDVAWAIGGILGGILVESAGYRAMFGILGVFEILALLYYVIWGRKSPSAFKVYQAAQQKKLNAGG